MTRIPPLAVTALTMAAVALGAVGAAFDDYARECGQGGVTSMDKDCRNGRARAACRAAEALLYGDIAAAWTQAAAMRALPNAVTARLRSSAAFAVGAALSSGRALLRSAGSRGLFETGALHRRVRDLEAISAHALVRPDAFALTEVAD